MSDLSIQISHGGGGRLSHELITNEIVSRFGDGPLKGLPDAASLPGISDVIIFSTDSYVVQPLFFPGGSIGHLAVHGTINDIAVAGGRPRWLSCGLIIEEGLPLSKLRKVLDDIKSASTYCDVSIVTGDTKVVARGQCDGLFINTAGIGEPLTHLNLSPKRIAVGDKIISSGTIGDHGMAIMAVREGISIGAPPKSDTAPVMRLVQDIATYGPDIKFMRDPTRGGVAAVCNDMAEAQAFGINLYEEAIPHSHSALAISEALGIDLLHVASEGRLLLVCSPDKADEIVSTWQKRPEGQGAAIIGEISNQAERVIMHTAIGGKRLVDLPQGEVLPRIC